MLAPMSARVAAVVILLLGCGSRRASEPAIAGLPPIDAPWTSGQLGQAATVIATLCAEAPTRLPTYGSRTFARLVAADNRSTIVAAPLAARVADFATHTGAVLTIYDAYFRCGRPTETLAANAALLEGYAASIADGDALIAAAPSGTPETLRKLAGREQKVAGLRGGIVSTIDLVADPQLAAPVPPELATRLGTAIAQVEAALGPAGLAEPRAHLDATIAASLEPTRKAALTAIRAAVGP